MKYIIASIIGLILPFVTLAAATSTNYQLNQEGSGFTEFNASSTNYQFDAVIGEPIVGEAISSNYILDQGKTWSSGDPTITILYAIPQLRYSGAGDNDDVVFFLTVRTSDNEDDVISFTSDTATSTVGGAYHTPIELTDISTGLYDIGFKGKAHLTRVLQDVSITSGNTVLNFSETDYSLETEGSVVLLAGDINGSGVGAANFGDDVVNSVDLSIILAELDDSDPTGNDIRSNFNQDTAINSVDLSIMLDNLDVEGDN